MAPDTRMPEPPAALTAKTVVRTDFTVVRKGFNPDDVIVHLGRVAEYVADLEATIADRQAQLRERDRARPSDEAARDQAYESTAARIADLMRTFDRDMERLRAESASQAEARLAEAHANAERIDAEATNLRAEAEAEAQRVVREATEQAVGVRAEAERSAQESLGTLYARREALIESVRRIREGLARTAEAVDGVLRGTDAVRVDDAVDETATPVGPHES
jgi:hypothetical protein